MVKNARKRIFLLLIAAVTIALPLIFLDEDYIYHPTIQEITEQEVDQEPKLNILIDLDQRVLNLYQGEKLIKTYPVSGGKPSTPTPIGIWTIVGKAKWGEGFGGGWMAFNVPWGKYGIHGTVYPWLIGENASKGCIRMYNKDVRELYKIVPIGTKVTIVHKSPVRRDLEQGDVGSDVLDVQKKLKELGYYNGGFDGKFGFQLQAAIKGYQKDNGIKVTGKLGPKTFTALFGENKENIQDDNDYKVKEEKDNKEQEVKQNNEHKDQQNNEKEEKNQPNPRS